VAEEKNCGISDHGLQRTIFTDNAQCGGESIGNEGEGYKVALSTLDGGSIGHSAQAGHRARRIRSGAEVFQERMAFRPPIRKFKP